MKFKKAIITELKGVYHGSKKHNGSHAIRLRFHDLNMKEVREYGNHYSEIFADKGIEGYITCAIDLPDLGFRTGLHTDIGNDVELYDFDQYDSWTRIAKMVKPYTDKTVVKTFDMYIYKSNPKPTGGRGLDKKDKFCFYKCVKSVYPEQTIPNLPTAHKFMKRFGLKDDDAVDISLIPAIEDTIHCAVDVIGDHIYQSKNTSLRKIKLLLQNGHYTIVRPESKKNRTLWSKHERVPLSAYYKNGEYICYDGEKSFTMTYPELTKEKITYSSKYIVLPNANIKETNYIQIQKEFCKIADGLKKASSGRINQYKTGGFKSTALNLLYLLTSAQNQEYEDMDNIEALWHESCMNGGKIYTKQSSKEYEKLYKYDYCSMYPSIMKSNKTIPIKKGEYQFVSDELKSKKFFPKGIYRAIVSGESSLFTFNPKNYYTNVELNCAKNIFNLEIKFIEDGDYNFLEYTNDKCVKLSSLFEEYVDILFDLKRKKVDGAKQILNILWGALCEKFKDKSKKRCREIDTSVTFDIPEHCELQDIVTVNTDTVKIIYKNHTKLYKGELPRIKAFMTAYGREIMYNLLNKHMDNVKLILTDGLLTDKPIFDDISKHKRDATLGDLVKEGYYKNMKIKHSNTSYKPFEFIAY